MSLLQNSTMPANTLHLIAACLAMVLLTVVVGMMMLVTRVREMQAKRLHPQSVATSGKMAARLENTQPADNFRNLLEFPVLFYALVAVALATTTQIPPWLVVSAWVFVALRVLHTLIHVTYNNVLHRLAVFAASFLLLFVMWIAFFVSIATKG
jgi:hypothetical protein